MFAFFGNNFFSVCLVFKMMLTNRKIVAAVVGCNIIDNLNDKRFLFIFIVVVIGCFVR